MIKIGVLSDTHIPRRAKQLPVAVLEGIAGVDLIIHAGDINMDYVIYELEQIAPVHAVAGNTDDDYILDMLGQKNLITVAGCRIGVVHGDGVHGTTMERASKAFINDKVDCIVFGHSHIPVNEKINGILYFNPGSPTDKRREKYFSYGILTVNDGKIAGEIKYFR